MSAHTLFLFIFVHLLEFSFYSIIIITAIYNSLSPMGESPYKNALRARLLICIFGKYINYSRIYKQQLFCRKIVAIHGWNCVKTTRGYCATYYMVALVILPVPEFRGILFTFFPLLSFACALLTLGTFDIIYVQIFFMCCAKQRKKWLRFAEKAVGTYVT